MVAILQMAISNSFSCMKIFVFRSIPIALEFIPKGPIKPKPVLGQINASRRAKDGLFRP